MRAFSEIRHGDALTILRSQPTHSAHLCCTDPPYKALEKHRAHGTTTRYKDRWFDTLEDVQIGAILQECYRVLVPGAHAYVFCNYDALFGMWPQMEGAGFTLRGEPLVWRKNRIGMGYHYRGKYELILMGTKGEGRATVDQELPDVIDGKRVTGGYPTAKPVEVLRALIQQSARPGELVIDPFCGSGSTGEAALSCGCAFLGIDTSEEAVALSRARLTATAV